MITVLMPVYKGLEYIDEAIASIEAQTFPHWELLIGVNGYWRESPAWIECWRRETKRIKALDVFWTNGKSETLNVMMEYAQTDLVALLDVDDWWHARKLSIQYHLARDYDVIGTGTVYTGERTGHPDIPYGIIDAQWFKQINPIVNSSALIHRADARWDPEFEGVEDYELWSRLAAAGRTFYNVPQVLTHHRIHATSAFNTRRHDDKIAKIHERYHICN